MHDKFLDILISKVKAQVIGDGLDEATGGGPVVSIDARFTLLQLTIMWGVQVSKGQYDRVWGYIESGKKEGAIPVLGGEKRTTKGYFVDPTSGFKLLTLKVPLKHHYTNGNLQFSLRFNPI